MRCPRVKSTDQFLDPLSRHWEKLSPVLIRLTPTPIGLQPTDHIRASWVDRPYGVIDAIRVAAVHDGGSIVVRLEWPDPTEDLGEGEGFPDGAVVAFPVRGEPALVVMGAEDAPIHGMHWSARNDELRSVLATGIGSSRPGPEMAAKGQGIWRDGAWRLAVHRELSTSDDGATLVPGEPARIGFAVWDGGNQERAGIKSFTPDWTTFALDA